MQKAISYRDATGALYDIPEEEAEAFKREMPQARPVRTFRDAAGAVYDVPEEEAEAFRADMPRAEPVRIVRAAGGEVFEVPDSERETFLRGYRSEPEFEADRQAARARVEAAAAAAPEGRGGVGAGEAVARGLADAGVTITKGIAGVPQLAAGLADLAIEANPATHVQRAVYGGRYPKGGMAGRALERVAPLAATQAALQEQYSDEQQKAFGEVSGADGSGLAGRMERAGVPGFMARPVGKAVAMAGKLAQHPTVIAHQALESLPAMGVGGMIGRGVAPALRAAGMAPAAAAMAGGAVGEGAAAAGSLQEQIRAATPGGATTPGQTLAAVAAGVGTAGFGMLSGRIGRKLGLEAADIDTLLAGGTTPKIQRSVLGRIAAGALQEGLLEELPQSANEKILENLATGRPWSEGVIEAGVTGAAVGGVMGAGANLGARGRGTGETLNAQRATLNAQGGTGETLNAQGATRNAQGGMGDGGLPTPNALAELPAAPGLTREVQAAVPILDRRPLGAGIFTEPPAAPVGPTVAAAEAMRVNREVEAGWQAAQARREQAKLDRKQETIDKRKAARQPGAESEAARTRRLSLESFYDRNHTRLNLPMVERMLAGQVFRAPSKRNGGENDAWKALGEKYPELRMRMSRDTRGGPGIPIEVAAQEEGMQPDEMVAQIEREWNEYQEWKRNDGRLAEDNPDQAIAERAVENLTVPVETTTDRLAPGDMVRTPDGQWRRVEREPDTVILADGTDIVLPEDSEQAVRLEAHVPAGEPGIEEARAAYMEQERAMWAEAERERIAAETAAPGDTGDGRRETPFEQATPEEADARILAAQTDLERARWGAIERTYFDALKAEKARPDIPLSEMRKVGLYRGHGSDSVTIDEVFVKRGEEGAADEALRKKHNVQFGDGRWSGSSAVGYFTPKTGEPTYEEWKAGARPDFEQIARGVMERADARNKSKGKEGRHARSIQKALNERKPVSAVAVDAYGIDLPTPTLEGEYIRSGSLYIFDSKLFPAPDTRQLTQVAEKGAAQPEPGPAALALEGQTQEQMDAEAQARTAEEQRREMLARAAAPIEGNAGDTTAVIPGMEGEVAPNLFDAAEVEARRALDLPPIETQAVAEQKPVEQSAPTTAPASKSPELMTPEQDAAYMRAVESGDTATARRMVDEAARRAFLYRYLLSGTVHPSIKSSYATDFPPMAVHFAERMQAIGAPRPGKTGDGVVRVYSRDGAIYRTQNEYSLPTGATPLNEYSPIEVREGKHLEMVGPTDPVTYDDAGRVIPLSERFNPVPPPGWLRQSARGMADVAGDAAPGSMAPIETQAVAREPAAKPTAKLKMDTIMAGGKALRAKMSPEELAIDDQRGEAIKEVLKRGGTSEEISQAYDSFTEAAIAARERRKSEPSAEPAPAKNKGLKVDKEATAKVATDTAQAAQTTRKPPELMTPEEFEVFAVGAAEQQHRRHGTGGPFIINDQIAFRVRSESEHRRELDYALDNNNPVSAAAVDAYKIKLPEGYVREGDRYVYKGESSTPTAPTSPPQVPVADAQAANEPGVSPSSSTAQDIRGAASAAGMADVAGDAAPGSMAPVVRTADDPRFSIMPVELPEAVDFARQALGRFPRVKAVIRALHGTALGVYKGSAQGPVGIELKRSIFNLLQESDYRQATEDAEAWAAANWREQPGGPTRDAAVQAWRKARLEEVAELRLGENPKEASNVLWHEIGHWIDDVPNWMLEKRGNILGHIATLNTYTKQMLSRVPPNDEAAIPAAKERAKLRAQAEREAGKRPGKNDAEGLKAWRAGVNGRYGELVEAAAAERGLVTRKALLAELNGLIAWWHGTESIPDYFTKPSEMYADAFSVLVNNPGAVRERAPRYYALWQAWLGEKPAARELWNRYQMDAVLGRVGDMRDRRQIEGIAEASAHREKQLRAKLVLSAQQSRDAILGMVYSGSYSIRRRVDLAKRRGRLSVAERMQKALQDDIYQHSCAMGYMMEVQDKVGRRVFVDAGVPMAEWQVFLQNRQIAENRKGIASMYGMNPAAANEALARQRERLGEARYGAMLEAQAQWHELRKRYVIGVALEKGLINAELAELMEDRAAYSHVAAVDVDVDPVQAVFRAAYGAEVGARIHKQEGFLGLAADPWQATLELDRNLIAAAHKNDLKNALAAMLADADEELYQPAGERFDVGLKRNVPVTGEGVRASTLVAMRDGKPWSFWAPQEVVDFVDSADSMSGGVMTRLINTLLRKLKGVYTWMNYGFSIFNTPRDIQDWIRNLPGWKGRRTYNKYQALAAPVVKSIVDGRPTEQAAEILRANILLYFPQGMKPGDNRLLQQIGEKVGGRVGRALEAVGPQTAMERMVAAYDLRPDWMGLDVSGREKVLEGIKRWYMKPNTRGEMTRKVAAWLYLKDKYPDMTDAERQRMVQMYGGSPDFANTPKKNPVIDAVLPFYNPFLRGWESGLKAFSEEPVRVTLTTMRYGVIPKLMLAAIGTGMLRDLLKRTLGEKGEWYGEELRKMTQFIPQYYKDNYAVHPIWWDPTDPTHTKVIFETSPLSENNRFASALIWKMLSKEDMASLFDFGADQLPGLNPILTLGYQWNQVLRGQAPKGIGITETQIDAGAAMSPMLRETFNQLSGGMLGRIPREGVGDVNLSPLEKLLRAPIVSNTIGRRIRVSNRGWQEGLTKQAANKYGKERAVARQEAWNAALEYGRSGALPAEAAVRQANGAMWMAARPAGMEPTAYMLTIDKNDGLDAYFAERLNDYMLEVNLQQAGPVQRAIQRAPWTERMEMIRGYGK